MPVYVPNVLINDIVRDHSGLLWIATNDGLIRFGSSSDVFVYNTSNVTALKSNLIETVFVDSKGILWIGTRYGGLSYFNQEKGIWKTYVYSADDPTSISSNEILSVLEDSKGRIWIGTESGLNLFDPRTEKFTRFVYDTQSSTSLSNKAVLCIYEDTYGFLWVTTWNGGLNIFVENEEDISKSFFKRLRLENNKAHQESIWKIYQDEEQHYWFGSHFSGLFYAKLTKQEIASFKSDQLFPHHRNFRHDPSDINTISSDIHISDIEKDSEGNLWASTSNGLSKLSHQTLEKIYSNKKKEVNFLRFNTDPFNNTSLPSEEIKCLHRDDSGILWIGTDRGLASFNGSNAFLKFFEIQSKDDNILTVSDIFYNSDNKLIIGFSQDEFGVFTGGLGVFDFEKNRVVPINEVYPFVENISDLKTTTPINRNEILIIKNSGIQHVNFKDKSSIEISIPPKFKSILSKQIIRSVFRDSKGRLWLSFDGSLIMLESDGESFVNLSEGKYLNFLSDFSITSVVEDYKNRIWISSYNGLNLVTQTDTGYTCKKYFHDAYDTSSIPSNRLISMVISDKTLFFGTPNGIISYDIDSNIFDNLEVGKGKETIHKVMVGRNNEIWANSKNKIIYYNQESKDYYTFRDKSLSFYHGAIYSDNEKYLWVGGLRGFVRLDFSKINETINHPVALIPEVTIFDSEGSHLINSHRNSDLTLTPDVSRFEISFCSDNLFSLEYNQYAYRMVGFEDEWTYTNNTKPIAYTNLDHGSYRFEIKTANDMGQWSKDPTYINFYLKAAFWETNWFKIITLLFIGLLIYFLFKIYNYRVVKANLILKQEINKRIETEEQLKVVNSQLKDTNKEMERFAFVASHDLKEPLRTIGAFSSLINQKYKDKIDDRGRQYLGHITQGVSRMYNLIESLLNYSSNKEADLEIEELDLNEIMNEVRQDLSEIISNQNAIIHFEELPNIHADKVHFHMLMSNLIKNGLKFNESDSPSVTVSEIPNNEGMITLSIKDNGIGISKEQFDDIFIIFKRLHGKSTYEGSGIGLALCKKIMERHLGEIWLESESSNGTTFYVSFPVVELKRSQEEMLTV